ncbi:MAG TPA: tetratricopeptide repeat protein [Anaeromyxobacteraceae bacterium]|nr:tetratricopeptide repeat protein [Anaeromyxobacteraceae bacterium]
MNRDTLIGMGLGLVIGLLGGLLIGLSMGGRSAAPPAPVAQPAPGAPAPNQAQGANIAGRISMLEQITAREPKNVQAWVELGNAYFDTRQPKKAADAYERALEVQPNNPDVLTDQGVMFRDLGLADRALANFQKAASLDKQHLQSRFNQGIVLAFDKKEPQKAIAVWNELIALAPSSPQAAQARQLIQDLQAQGSPPPAAKP